MLPGVAAFAGEDKESRERERRERNIE